jgi:NADPH:quinone reductase-like Zn-dependent oxidoreductase
VSTAIAFSAYGEPEVLEAIDVAKFRPGEGHVLVRVKSAGVRW